MRGVFGLLFALVCLGCGQDKTTRVGRPGETGIALDTIQRAQDVAERSQQRADINERTLSSNR